MYNINLYSYMKMYMQGVCMDESMAHGLNITHDDLTFLSHARRSSLASFTYSLRKNKQCFRYFKVIITAVTTILKHKKLKITNNTSAYIFSIKTYIVRILLIH